MSATRVIIVEDEPLFREMLFAQLDGDAEIEVLAQASTGEQAVAFAETFEPEVMLLDIDLGPGISGIEAGHAIKSFRPTTGIVLLSNHNSKQYVVTSAGWSYLLKRNVRDLDAVARAIKGAAWGMIVVDPMLTSTLTPRAKTALAGLTSEQVKILELLAHGHSDHSISQEMVMEEDRVVRHLYAIYTKLNIAPDGESDPRVKAVRAYLDQTSSM